MKTLLNFLRTLPFHLKTHQKSHAASKNSQIPSKQTRECKVCFDHKPASEFPSRSPSEACKHAESEVCKGCLRESIKSEFEGNALWKDLVHCPSCRARLEFKDVREFAGEEIFRKYDAYLLRRFLLNHIPDFRWCHNPRCKSGEEYTSSKCSDDPLVICSACSAAACFMHDMPWHYGRTCAQFDKLLADGENEKAINGNKRTRMCPECGTPIYKTGGCDLMDCVCGRVFDWKRAPQTMRDCTKLV